MLLAVKAKWLTVEGVFDGASSFSKTADMHRMVDRARKAEANQAIETSSKWDRFGEVPFVLSPSCADYARHRIGGTTFLELGGSGIKKIFPFSTTPT